MAKEPKLVTCKHCGAEIAASAKTCPQCGGKNKKPFYKNPLLIALVIIVIIVAVATSGEDSKSTETTNGSSTAAESQKPEIVYTAYDASELMNDLDANALSAADKYKGQYVELTGTLKVIDSSGDYISLFPDDGSIRFVGVTCYLKSDDQTKVVMDCTIGDTLVVKGKITEVGEVMGYTLTIDEISKSA